MNWNRMHRLALLSGAIVLSSQGSVGGHEAAALRAAYSVPSTGWPVAQIAPRVAFVELAALAPAPPTDVALAALGRRLFFDPILSASVTISCADCHQPTHGWGDSQPLSLGHDGHVGKRNTPALISVARRKSWPWDGSRNTLATQVLAPLTVPEEMGNNGLDALLDRLAATNAYPRRFASAGRSGSITAESLAAALTAFLQTLEQPTRFDRFAAGETSALGDREIFGLHLFRTKAGCANCHFGPLLTDEKFHNLGLSSFGEPAEDLGRYHVTRNPEDVGAFRTPSLRHVAVTGPYMHSGLFASLGGVVRFYVGGGGTVWARNEDEARRPLYGPAADIADLIRPRSLDEQEILALVAFLRTL